MVIAIQSQALDRFIVDFKKCLHKAVFGLKEVFSTEQCDFILDFCLITSRAGTDIDAAIKSLDQFRASKEVIMGVLYPTIDPEKTIPDSNSAIKKENLYLVDFLFNEDIGFMKCQKNNDAIKKLAQYIKSKNLTSYCLQNGNSHQSSYQDAENSPLITSPSPLNPRPEDRPNPPKKAFCIGIVATTAALIVVVVVITAAFNFSQF